MAKKNCKIAALLITALSASLCLGCLSVSYAAELEEHLVRSEVYKADHQFFTMGEATFYTDLEGNPKTGWIYDKASKTWYVTDEYSWLLKGWQKIGGKWYYMDDQFRMQTGWLKLSDGTYFLQKNGAMKTGWIYEDGKWYYANSSGRLTRGWVKVSGKWYYMGKDFVMKTGRLELADGTYVLQPNGVMKKGWIYEDGNWYYANNSGRLAKGWEKINGKWYFLNRENFIMATGILKSGSYSYYMNKSGAMETGWAYDKVEGKWFLADNTGRLLKGWNKVSGKWYYIGSDYRMKTGFIKLSDGSYYLQDNGVMKTGWVYDKENGKWYYAKGTGRFAKGWEKVGGKWYYMSNDYSMVKGLQNINGTDYLFNNSGAMLSDTTTAYDGKVYLVEPSGRVHKSNLTFDNGKVKYKTDSGFAIGFVKDGDKTFYFDKDGSLIKGWKYIDGNWYYFDDNGFMVTGWKKINGDWYYMNSNGKMVKNEFVGNYFLDKSGRMVPASNYAKSTYDSLKVKDLNAAFMWASSIPYKRNVPSYSTIEDYARYGFVNKTGNCYVIAAVNYVLGKMMGYDIYQVWGYIPLLNGNLSEHSWLEVKRNGQTYVLDPEFYNETGIEIFMKPYGSSWTPQYRKSGVMH